MSSISLIKHCFILILLLSSTSASMATERSFGVSATDPFKLELYENLSSAQSEAQGRQAEDSIWEFWFSQSPTSDVRALLDAGLERREAYDYEAAENRFDEVIASAPEYTEGYNQRAFIRFLRQNYSGAQVDLEAALELDPTHFGAMSGTYHVLMIQNRPKAALKMLQRAVAIHPWLKERRALPEAMWPESYRAIHQPKQEI